MPPEIYGKNGSYKDRLMAKVRKDASGCWIWEGTSRTGHSITPYGQFWYKERMTMAHRAAWELFIGPVPDGKTLDHKCRVTLCVNPDHLEPVTNRENILRGTGPSAINARKTLCIRGHELTQMETQRRCLTCQDLHNKARGVAVHYQPDAPDYTGDGNFEPIACGREEADKLSHSWGSVTCNNCLRTRAGGKEG